MADLAEGRNHVARHCRWVVPQHTGGTCRKTDWQSLIRLLEALKAQKIRHVVIGMSAAVAQGVLANTLDVDVWIDLPKRHYMRVENLARKPGGTVVANTVVYLEDGTPVNFV